MASLDKRQRARRWYEETMKIHRSPNPDLQKVIAGYRKSLEFNPDDAEVIYALGVALLGRGEVSAARDQITRALELKPRMPEARFHLGQCHLRLNEPVEAEKAFRAAIENTPRQRRGPLYFAMAVALQAQERLKEAEECYRLGLELSPEDFAGNFQFAVFLQNTDRLDEAAGLLDKLLERDPRNRDVLNFRALIHSRQQQLPKAVECLERALEDRPRDAGLLFNLAQMVEQTGERQRAEELLRKSLEIQPQQPGALSRLAGLIAGADRKFDEALELLERALELVPDEPGLLYQKAAVLFELGRPEESEQLLETVLEKRPQFKEAQALLSRLKQEGGAIREDPEELRKALEQDPGNPELKARLLQTHLLARRYDEALPLIDELLELKPDDAGLRLNRGIVLSNLAERDAGKLRAAREELRAALGSFETKDPGGLLRLAQVNLMLREPEEAVDSIDELLSRAGEPGLANLDPFQLWHLKGVALQQKAFFPEAVEAYTKARERLEDRIAEHPEDSMAVTALREAVSAMSQMLDQLGRFEQAASLYERWIELGPRDSQPLARLANLYNRNGRFEEGLATLRKLEQLDPDNARTQYFLGLTLTDLERQEEAESCLAKALELEPEFPEAQQRLQVLQQNRPLVAASIDELEESVEQDPEDKDDRLLLSQAYMSRKQWDKAAEHLKVLTEQDTGNHRALFDLSSAHHAAGRLDQAIDCLIRLEERLPTDPGVRYRLAQLLMENEEEELAVKEYKHAVEMQPRNPVFQFSFGQALRAVDREEPAEEAIRKALELQEQFPAAHYELGLLEYTTERHDSALKSFATAAQQNPAMFMAHYYCGMIHKNATGKLDEAARYFQQSLGIRPDFGDAHFQLGQLFKDGRRSEDARYHLRAALEHWEGEAFNRPAAESMLKELDAEE